MTHKRHPAPSSPQSASDGHWLLLLLWSMYSRVIGIPIRNAAERYHSRRSNCLSSATVPAATAPRFAAKSASLNRLASTSGCGNATSIQGRNALPVFSSPSPPMGKGAGAGEGSAALLLGTDNSATRPFTRKTVQRVGAKAGDLDDLSHPGGVELAEFRYLSLHVASGCICSGTKGSQTHRRREIPPNSGKSSNRIS